ncbi:hypothetical protein BerOc1_02137 [Pseudodesulfovibrio hydrargyri]|uniref:Transporter n=1 Tax=Pseudodesulfovibrio hydrargyri TaxID=2125990 RepID=A0A1J5NAF4_9BACT|nr:transporter [Pseudodesulfovibrio hydrargyri]OIQ50207.1 hypothetical protein BerOc1_02137 [Pseudodesulfovibrio hydrargyri]
MKRVTVGVLACLLVVLLCGTAMAEGPVHRCWTNIGATFGPGGLGIPKGFLAVGGNVTFAKSNGIWKSSQRRNGKVKTTKLNEIFKTRYGIMESLDIRTATPIYNVHVDKANGADRETYGIGDTTVLLHKGVFNQQKGDLLSVAVDFGGIVPTASVGSHSSNFVGNDAWGAMFGLGATYFIGANRFDTEVNFASFAEGAQDYQKGNRTRWNLGYAYALSEFWDIGAESSWEMSDESRYDGHGQQDAYVEWYAGPKVTFKYKPWKLFAGLLTKAPVHRWYESNKVGSDDFRVEFKLIKLFDIGSIF